MSQINIFLTGATGYIGGSVLAALLRHPRSNEFHITVLVRAAEKAAGFREVGVTAVVGSYADKHLLTNHAAQSDVVIACADADDVPATEALLAGLKKRHQQTSTAPILIHTSGIGVFIDNADGNFASDEIYSDLDLHKLEALPRTQPHREVDLAIADAGKEGYAKTHVILPGLVYGIAKTRLVSLQLSNSRSQQIPSIVNAGLARRQGGVVGKGLNIWSNVHIEDVVHLYMCIFDYSVNYHRPNGFYYGVNGECAVGDISRVVAEELHDRGCGDRTPTVFTKAEVKKYLVSHPSCNPFIGSNARARGDRARSLGWKPKHTNRDMLDSISDEVAASMGTQV
ncbi:hypothetical protein HYDPIDRAFT_128710 [Hydnomerulius pinastri MD-312]|nr:hypothetical protein HYDPIDRAFT_128710 [Hydnomerulius pinastri MD-312]